MTDHDETEGRCFDTSNDCPIHGHHYGKFQDCLSEAVWEVSLDSMEHGYGAEEGGDTDGPGYFVLLPGMHDFPHAAYIVTTVSSGAVYVHSYDSDAEARAVWDAEIAPVIEDWEKDTFRITRHNFLTHGSVEEIEIVRGFDAEDALEDYWGEHILPRMLANGWEEHGDCLTDPSCGCVYVHSYGTDGEDFAYSDIDLMSPCERDMPEEEDWEDYRGEYALCSYIAQRIES